MNKIRAFFGFFSPFVHPFEKKAERFLSKLNATSKPDKVHQNLLNLMQEDLAKLNLWLEKRSKNYRKLSKKYRSKCHKNLETIVDVFERFEARKAFPEEVYALFQVEKKTETDAKARYLWKIMSFCKNNFHYREGSSFDKLFADVRDVKMIGDCNQITTFYAYLYALKFPISDLQIRLFDGHVALHFQGLDIEATKGEFVKHKREGRVLEITEIISTNLLDVADIDEKKANLAPQTFLKNARLAFLLSSLKDVVQHNLDVALQKMAIHSAKNQQFNQALAFVEKIENVQMRLKTRGVYSDAVKYFVGRKNFKKAHFFAKKLQDKQTLLFVTHHEVKDLVERKRFKIARRVAQALNNPKMLHYIARQEYSQLAREVKDIKDLKEAKRKKHVYRKLLKLAQEGDNREAEQWVKGILGKLK